MKTLLVITAGQTDVQLVQSEQRLKLDGNTCGTLHDAINERTWSVVDAPKGRSRSFITALPEGELTLCTPKLDAVLAHLDPSPSVSVLVLETRRRDARDPRFAGEVMERRLRHRGVSTVTRVAFLTGDERLEDPSNDLDAVVRRSVVVTLSIAVGRATANLGPDDLVYVATTGGLPAANALIGELVRLHCVGGPRVTALEVPDGDRVEQGDRAVEEKFCPAAGYRARWHALSLIERGHLLGAWGAVSHLEGVCGQEWVRVVQWLKEFASSLPLSRDCDLAVLRSPRMAVRAALRVDLALRAGDIPRAVQGTVAFSESALWDKLLDHFERSPTDNRCLKPKPGAQVPVGRLLREGVEDDMNRPFESRVCRDGQVWFRFHESGGGRFARDYVRSEPLKRLLDAIEKIRALRNDVAHNEPTPTLMNDARTRMRRAALWSSSDTFLGQPLVQALLKDLGEVTPDGLLAKLMNEVRHRLVVEPAEAENQRDELRDGSG